MVRWSSWRRRLTDFTRVPVCQPSRDDVNTAFASGVTEFCVGRCLIALHRQSECRQLVSIIPAIAQSYGGHAPPSRKATPEAFATGRQTAGRFAVPVGSLQVRQGRTRRGELRTDFLASRYATMDKRAGICKPCHLHILRNDSVASNVLAKYQISTGVVKMTSLSVKSVLMSSTARL